MSVAPESSAKSATDSPVKSDNPPLPTGAMLVEIYALMHGDRIRYVGKADDSNKRLASHMRDSQRRNTPVYAWIRKLLKDGTKPSFVVLERCTKESWPEREKYWIKELRESGADLLNIAEGGDQPFCPVSIRAENGRRNALDRVSTPRRKRLWDLKHQLGIELRNAQVPESIKDKLRLSVAMHPEKLGSLAKWL